MTHGRIALTAVLGALALLACSSDETHFADLGVADGGGTDGAVQPDGPATQPDGPPAQPDAVTAQPDGPATQPDGPATQPDGPAVQPDGPAVQPDGPAVQPDVSTAGGDPLNTGDESGDQPSTGEVGAPCSSDGQCDDHTGASSDTSQGAVCLKANPDGFPGGYCSFLCSKPASLNYGCNGAGGVYVPYSNSWGDGYCYHPCVTPKDCRAGYRCSGGACMPDCAQAGCKVGTCDPTKLVCVAK